MRIPMFSRRPDAGQEMSPEETLALREKLDSRLKSIGTKHSGNLRSVTNKRLAERIKEFRVAAAAFEPGHQTSCRVVDQSENGLRLEFDREESCPEEFALTIPTLRFIGLVRRQWQNDRSAGVSIVRWCETA